MTISTEFEPEQTVYLRTDPEQWPRLVTGILIQPTGIQYELSQGVQTSFHYGFEISSEKTLQL